MSLPRSDSLISVVAIIWPVCSHRVIKFAAASAPDNAATFIRSRNYGPVLFEAVPCLVAFASLLYDYSSWTLVSSDCRFRQ